jgi:hypothetical protein
MNPAAAQDAPTGTEPAPGADQGLQPIPFPGPGEGSYGNQNASVRSDPSGRFAEILHVEYPRHSSGRHSAEKFGATEGGYEYWADLEPQDTNYLSYWVRFSDNFDFKKGGKLPGVCAGDCPMNAGDVDPAKGYSQRLMWRSGGQGEAYLYIPKDTEWGLQLGTGSFTFQPGRWHHLEVETKLNTPGQSDGSLAVWLDGGQAGGEPQLLEEGLLFRSKDSVKIDRFFFTTFFGGTGPGQEWGPSEDVHADFAQIQYGTRRPSGQAPSQDGTDGAAETPSPADADSPPITGREEEDIVARIRSLWAQLMELISQQATRQP